MSKHRKHRQPPVAASKPAVPSGEVQSASSGTAMNPLARRIFWQFLCLLGASALMGFAFNASSPVGVRFSGNSSEVELAKTEVKTNLTAQPIASITNQILIKPASPISVAATTVAKPAAVPSTAAAPAPTTPPTKSMPAMPSTWTRAVTAQIPATNQLNPSPIHWPETKALVSESRAVLVDVRHRSMYDAGHIPGAISLPETSSPEEFTAFLNQYPTNVTLILYCSSMSCSQSARVANRLVTQFQRPSVKYMTGGYLEYQQEMARNPAPTTP